jgi:ABC-type phosphate transport system substrate-binding protein
MKIPCKKIALLAALVATSAAHAELVVIVSSANPTATLTPAQVSEVFLGVDNKFSPVDLPESAPQRATFYTKVTGRTLAQIKATWSRLIFSGAAAPPTVANSEVDAKTKVAADKNAIGYVDRSAVDASVKVVMVVD